MKKYTIKPLEWKPAEIADFIAKIDMVTFLINIKRDQCDLCIAIGEKREYHTFLGQYPDQEAKDYASLRFRQFCERFLNPTK